MSTYHTPFAFYGRYFSSLEAVQAFLRTQQADYDSDSVVGEPFDSLGLQFTDNRYILGFPLLAGESDAQAKALWAKRIGADDKEAKSFFDIFTY